MPTKDRPNLVFVFPDQMGALWLGCYANDQVQTPVIDGFAQQGVRFERAYTACPLCTPFRGTLFTGRYPSQTGIVRNGQRLPSCEMTLAELFNQGGYRTAYVGKWHLSGPPGGNRWVPPEERAGFAQFLGWESHHVDHWAGRIWGDDPDQVIPMPGHETDALTDLACATLAELAPPTISAPRSSALDPFCLFVAYQSPHPPCAPPAGDLETYQGRPLAYRPNVVDPELWYCRPEWRADYGLREFADRYRGEISHFDRAFGRLLAQIEALGLAGDTIVVLTSDHGEMAGSHGLYSKGVMYEEATRIPLLVRCPGGAQGVTHALFSSVDYLPTLLDLCDLSPASSAEGVSYGPLIRGEEQPVRESLVIQYHDLALCRDRYKLVADGGATLAIALYDLESDPYEQRNLVDEAAQRPVVHRLLNELRDWNQDIQRRVGDPAEASRPSPYL